MDKKKILIIGKYRVELILPNAGDLSKSPDNNISVYEENGQLLWTISQLLKEFSDKNGIKYYDDMYFDIKVLDKEIIFCTGFTNHCEIDMKSGSITKIVSNR